MAFFLVAVTAGNQLPLALVKLDWFLKHKSCVLPLFIQ